MQKILLDDMGLEYICTTAERFFAVGRVLGNMVVALAEQPSSRLLKHIIRCYLRLSDNPRLVFCSYIVLLSFSALDFQKIRPQTPSSHFFYTGLAMHSEVVCQTYLGMPPLSATAFMYV